MQFLLICSAIKRERGMAHAMLVMEALRYDRKWRINTRVPMVQKHASNWQLRE